MGIIFLPIKLALKLAVMPLKLVGPLVTGLVKALVVIPLLPFRVLSSLVSAISGSGHKGDEGADGPRDRCG